MTTNEVDEAKVVKAEAGDVPVVHEVLASGFEIVIFFPVTAHGKNSAGAFLNRYNIGQSKAGLIVVLINVRVLGQVDVDVHLKQLEPIIN